MTCQKRCSVRSLQIDINVQSISVQNISASMNRKKPNEKNLCHDKSMKGKSIENLREKGACC